jgi:TDG/mug DNA glycosylase family protein
MSRSFSREELQRFRGLTLPDFAPRPMRLLFVGINPGLHTVAVQTHFARRGNRFYKALFGAGITDHVIDASDGLRADDERQLVERGIGITSLVAGASARADELDDRELREGAALLESRVRDYSPSVVAILGITAYRTAFGERDAVVGRQLRTIGGAETWVVPNPSGLNAHAPLPVLAAAYREVAIAAGATL